MISDASISRLHATLVVERGQASIRDRGSRNGTRVNDVEVHGAALLHDGDRLQLGRVDLVYSATTSRAPVRSGVRLRSDAQTANDEPPPHGAVVTPLDDARRHAWWLDLHVELVERALTLWRLEEAGVAFERIVDGLEAHPEIGQLELDHAFAIALRLCAARGDSAPIAWSFQTLRRRGRAPSRALLDRLRTLPPILLEGALGPMEMLVHSLDLRTLDDADRELIEQLMLLCCELRAWRRTGQVDVVDETSGARTR